MTDPLAPLVPLARLAAIGLVAGAATFAAVHAGSVPPATRAADVTAAAKRPRVAVGTKYVQVATGTNNEQVAAAEASALLGEIGVPPGSAHLTSRPDGAPDLSQAPFLPQASTMVTRTTWWTSRLSQAATLAWMRAHPANGLFPSITGSSIIGFQGNGSGVIDQITVYAESFALPDGTTGIQLSSVVVYQPARSAQETIPAAAELVATPRFSGLGRQNGVARTFTDQAEIGRVAEIINALPTQPLGVRSCPDDTGGVLDLDFESGGGETLAQVAVMASGCTGTSVTTDGTQRAALSSDYETLQQIQGILGTDWQLKATLP